MLFQISYSIEDNNKTKIACVKDVELIIDVNIVFDVSVTYMSSKFEPVSKVYVGEPLIVIPNIKCLSPWPILIENTSFQLVNLMKKKIKLFHVYNLENVHFQAKHVNISAGGYQSVLNGVLLESDECASEVLCVTPSEFNENILGCFTINWKR